MDRTQKSPVTITKYFYRSDDPNHETEPKLFNHALILPTNLRNKNKSMQKYTVSAL